MSKRKTFYYSDELNEEFSGVSRNNKQIGDDYKYINKNPFWNVLKFIVYRLIMTPVAFVYCKAHFLVKVKNKNLLKPYKNQGYFLYGNHTQMPGDGYFPNIINFPKDSYEIVNADNVALKGTEQFMLMVGAMPIPSSIHGVKNFTNAIKHRIDNGDCITIYPEAHIWPYYTKIRPYKSVSFQYPVKLNSPTFCFTVTYQKRRFRKIPRATVYIDGPFFADESLSNKEKREDLRNQVYKTQVIRSQNSTYSYHEYISKDEHTL